MARVSTAHAAVAAAGALLAAGPLVSGLAVLHNNEQMYVAAGLLARDGLAVYRDFAFLQTPYLAWIHAGLFALAGGASPLLVGKLLSWALLLATAWLAHAIARRAAPGTWLAPATAALVLLDPVLTRAAEEASNYILPVALGLLAWRWGLAAVEGREPRPRAALLAGLALGAAVGTRLTYLAAVPPLLAAMLLYPREAPWRRRLARGVLPLKAGLAVALLPLLLAVLAAPRAALFDNWTYHRVNAQWRAATGAAAEMTPLGRLVEAEGHLLAGPTLLLLAVPLAALAGAWLARRRGGAPATWPAPDLFLSLGLVGCALAAALAPAPVFVQYFALPAGFAPALLAVAGRRVAARDGALWRGLLVVMVGVALLASGPHFALRLRDGRADGRVDRAAARIAAELQTAGVAGRVATLTPLTALRAGRSIYPELATGAFLFRSADRLDAATRARVRATSPAMIGDLLARDPPAAVFAGCEGELDAPLEAWARDRGYRLAEGDFGGGRLWVRARAAGG